jgi:hypothetical protein
MPSNPSTLLRSHAILFKTAGTRTDQLASEKKCPTTTLPWPMDPFPPDDCCGLQGRATTQTAFYSLLHLWLVGYSTEIHAPGTAWSNLQAPSNSRTDHALIKPWTDLICSGSMHFQRTDDLVRWLKQV